MVSLIRICKWCHALTVSLTYSTNHLVTILSCVATHQLLGCYVSMVNEILVVILVAQIDNQSRKLLTAMCNHHPYSAVERLYLPQGHGGLGLVNVENLYCRRLVALACHLCCSTDVFVQLCRELDESLPPRKSVISQAMEYYHFLTVPFDYTGCDSMCAVLCGQQLHSLTTFLLEKPLHGCSYSFVNMNDVDKQSSFM